MSYRYQIQDDVIVQQHTPDKFIERACAYAPQADDTLLVGYPRSGVTWLSYILYLMRRRGKAIEHTERLWEVIPEIGVGRRAICSFGSYFVQLAEMVDSPRVLRTHLPAKLAPTHAQAKYIYISRNPLDTAVSMYHDVVSAHEFQGRFDDFFDYFLHGQASYNCYFTHHLDWMKRACAHGEDRVLWLTYEQLVAQPADCVSRVGRHLGGVYAEVAADDAAMKEIVRNCSFASMKSVERLLENSPNGCSVFRRGLVGDFENFFSREQIERLQVKFRREFGGTRLEHSWTDVEKVPL